MMTLFQITPLWSGRITRMSEQLIIIINKEHSGCRTDSLKN